MLRIFQIMTIVCLLLMSGSIAQFIVVIDHIEHVKRVIATSHAILITMLNAETGQRGYIITGERSYLAPYEQAVAILPERLGALSTTMVDYNPEIHSDKVIAFSKEKVVEMEKTIKLFHEQGKEAAANEVKSHIGKSLMDSIRLHVDTLTFDADTRFVNYEHEGQWYGKTAMLMLLGTVINLFLVFKQSWT